MSKISVKRALFCFVLIIIINFLLPRMMKGNPISYLTGLDEELTSVQIEYYEKALHLDESLFKQFLYYLKSIFDGTLGYSFQKNSTVSTLIFERLKVTLLLVLPSAIIATIIGLSFGLKAGFEGPKTDKVLTPIMIIINSFPLFLISLLLILFFAFDLKLLPYSGLASTKNSNFLDLVRHLILPISTITIGLLPSRYLLVRNMTQKIAKSRCILYQRERGLGNNKIRYFYILPELLTTFLTNVGLSIGSGIAGSVVVESIFSINGMGRLLTQAVYTLDYPLMYGILFVTSLAMLISIIIVDILSFLLDPRQRRKLHD